MFAFNLKSIFWGTMLWRATVYNGTKVLSLLFPVSPYVKFSGTTYSTYSKRVACQWKRQKQMNTQRIAKKQLVLSNNWHLTQLSSYLLSRSMCFEEVCVHILLWRHGTRTCTPLFAAAETRRPWSDRSRHARSDVGGHTLLLSEYGHHQLVQAATMAASQK